MEFDLKKRTIQGIGPRKKMQDAGCIGSSDNREFSWLIVCDGIGGHKGGKEAADITTEMLNDYLRKTLTNEQQLNDLNFLNEGLRHVNDKFSDTISKDYTLHLMGCTLCMVVFSRMICYVFWSGDSRFYLFRDGVCKLDIFPHNWSFDLYRKGVLSLEEARISETSYLTGSVNNFSTGIRLDCEVIKLVKKDRILVCTDGIWGLFEHLHLIQIMTEQSLDKTEIFLHQHLKKYANDNYFGFVVDI